LAKLEVPGLLKGEKLEISLELFNLILVVPGPEETLGAEPRFFEVTYL